MQTDDERTPLRVILEFPRGLDGPPSVFPIVETDEEYEAIRRMFSAWNAWVVLLGERSKAVVGCDGKGGRP